MTFTGKRLLLLLTLSAGSAVSAPWRAAAQHGPPKKGDARRLLTADEVSRVSGLKVSLRKDSTEDTLVFVTTVTFGAATVEGMVLGVTLLPIVDWSAYKQQMLSQLTPLGGVGDEAREDRANLLVFVKKGKRVADVQAFPGPNQSGAGFYLTLDQLHELVAIIASRM